MDTIRMKLRMIRDDAWAFARTEPVLFCIVVFFLLAWAGSFVMYVYDARRPITYREVRVGELICAEITRYHPAYSVEVQCDK